MRESVKQDSAWHVFLKNIVFPTFCSKQTSPQEVQKTGIVRYCKSEILTQQSLYNQTKFSDTLESYETDIQDVSSIFLDMSWNLTSHTSKVLLNTDLLPLIKT